MLGPIALPRLPSATATAVLWPGRWPPASASIVSLAPCSSVSTDRCCCTSLLRVPLYERQDSAAALQSLRDDVRGCSTRRASRAVRSAAGVRVVLSMARCASAAKMPVIPATSSSSFEDSNATSRFDRRRRVSGVTLWVWASLVCRDRCDGVVEA